MINDATWTAMMRLLIMQKLTVIPNFDWILVNVNTFTYNHVVAIDNMFLFEYQYLFHLSRQSVVSLSRSHTDFENNFRNLKRTKHHVSRPKKANNCLLGINGFFFRFIICWVKNRLNVRCYKQRRKIWRYQCVVQPITNLNWMNADHSSFAKTSLRLEYDCFSLAFRVCFFERFIQSILCTAAYSVHTVRLRQASICCVNIVWLYWWITFGVWQWPCT